MVFEAFLQESVALFRNDANLLQTVLRKPTSLNTLGIVYLEVDGLNERHSILFLLFWKPICLFFSDPE